MVCLRRATHCLAEAMENRLLLSAGGGFTGAGITGSYYSNSSLTGTPSFTRVDDRVDFNFGINGAPGGTTDPSFAVGTSNWSAKWIGSVVPKYSEAYTLSVTSEGADRLYFGGNLVINDFSEHTTATDTYSTAKLAAGQSYSIELDYATTFAPSTTTPSQVRLHWSSPSTLDEDIEPASPIGLNVDGGDAIFANMINGATRNSWWVAGNSNANATTDSSFWPTQDAEIFLGEGDITLDSGGTYLIQFKGTATVTQSLVTASFHVGSTNYNGTLTDGAGYNSSTGLTTATMVISPGNYNGFILDFTNTSREDNTSSPQHDGITNVYVMQPTTLGGNTDPQPGTLFTNAATSQLSQYSVLRTVGPSDTNGNNIDSNIVSNWSDRTVVSDEIWSGWTISGGSNSVTTGTTGTIGAGVPWEVLIALANETGKDLYINVPSNASLTYIDNLAELFAYGSNGVTPYTSAQASPVWAPLNSNLKVYIEFSNEIWNSGFMQAGTQGVGWSNQLSQRALYDYETNNQNDPLYPGGGASAYNDGKFLDSLYNTSSGAISSWEATYNASGAYGGIGSPAYFSNPTTNGALNGYIIYQGWVALRLEQISAAFKNVFGETSINADSNSSRVRPVFEWQYGGSWDGELGDMQTLFGASHPVGYYLYGGGGGWYEDDVYNGFSDSPFANGNFATTPAVSGYQQNPSGTGWTFNGSAGIAANGSTLGNPTAPTLGPNNNPVGSGQTAYLQPGASISQSVTFSGGWADITLLACQTLQPGNYYYGLTISIDGAALGESEGAASFSGSQNAWTWDRTTAFNVSAGTHTVTFTNTWNSSSGVTVFIDNLGIQTVNGMFGQTASSGAPSISTVQSDVNICQQYGLLDVGYEGGFDFNQNLDNGDNSGQGVNGYSEMGTKGYSMPAANVGEEANLDSRTVPLAEAAIDQFYLYGGTLPIEFESSGNDNSWAVAAPTYFNTNTPKQQAVNAVEQGLPPAAKLGITVPATLTPLNKGQDYNDSYGTLQTGGWISWEISVPVTGTYTFTATTTTGGSYSLTLSDTNVLGTGISGGTINPSATLAPGLYFLQMQATSGSFTVSQVVVAETGAPASPLISSSSLNGSTATLSWSAVSGATGYIIGYGSATGQYSTFIDEGNQTTATITGLNPAAVDYFAVYAYNSSGLRSLPSNEVRLAPYSTDPSALINFEDQSDTAANGHLTEPFIEAGEFSFTSRGNSAGSALQIQDGTSASNWPGGWPSKVLMAANWGTDIQLVRADGHSFDLSSLDVGSMSAYSAVLTGYDASGGTLQYIVNFPDQNQHYTLVNLNWVDITQFQVSWWNGTNGTPGSGSSPGQRFGSIDNLLLDNGPPVMAPAAPSALSASASSSTQINLAWTDNSNNETGFRIDRATDSGFTQNLTTFTVGVNVTSYSDSTLTAGITHYYRVYAYNGSGTSAYSNTASATTPLGTIVGSYWAFQSATNSAAWDGTYASGSSFSPNASTLAGPTPTIVASSSTLLYSYSSPIPGSFTDATDGLTYSGGPDLSFGPNTTGNTAVINLDTAGAFNFSVSYDYRNSAAVQPTMDYSTNGGSTWTAIPGNLLPTLATDDNYHDSSNAGRADINLSTITAINNLPAVELRLDVPNTGSGTFRIDNLQVIGNEIPTALVVTGSNYLELDGTTAGQLDVWAGTTNTGSPTSTYQLSQIAIITDSGTSGNDTLTVNFTNGDPLAAGTAGISFDTTGTIGGTDALVIVGDNHGDTDTVSNGQILVTGGSGASAFTAIPITFANVAFESVQAGTGPAALSVSGGATLSYIAPAGGTYPTAVLSSLVISSGSKVVFSSPNSSRALLELNTASAWAGQLNLQSNDMLVHGGSSAFTTVNSLVAGGYSNGTWTGTGIISSTAATSITHLTALGAILNSFGLSSFDGASALATDVLVKYTYYGDTNFDGKVDGSDYSKIDNGYLTHLTGWSNGDFNYDGVINGSDYTLIDNAFNTQGAILSVQIAGPTAILSGQTRPRAKGHRWGKNAISLQTPWAASAGSADIGSFFDQKDRRILSRRLLDFELNTSDETDTLNGPS